MNKTQQNIVIYEDEAALTTEPLSLTRPVWKLLCGVRTLEEKIVAPFKKANVYYYARQYLENTIEGNSVQDNLVDGDAIWINASLLPDEDFPSVVELRKGSAWIKDGKIVAFRGGLPANWPAGTQLPADSFHLVGAPAKVGLLLDYPWQLVNAANGEIRREGPKVRPLGVILAKVHKSAVLRVEENIFMAKGCDIGPNAVIDAAAGPVILDDKVSIGANSVVEGPTYLGPRTQVKPLSHIRGSCLGEECRVGGEISTSIMQGYSNKQHGGFMGNSYIGSWCNLGSGTETSNLKNNYTHIKVQVGSELVDTEEMFVGLMMGDHSKSAIGTVFNTGAVIGVGCNIFGQGFPPRYVPSFNWGGAEKLTPYPLKPTLQTAEAMMKRRGKELNQGDADVLKWIHQNRSYIIKNS